MVEISEKGAQRPAHRDYRQEEVLRYVGRRAWDWSKASGKGEITNAGRADLVGMAPPYTFAALVVMLTRVQFLTMAIPASELILTLTIASVWLAQQVVSVSPKSVVPYDCTAFTAYGRLGISYAIILALSKWGR